MANHRKTRRIERAVTASKRRIAKFENIVRETNTRKKADLHEELFHALRKIRRLKVSCASSLEKEIILQHEISLCQSRTSKLEALLLSCRREVKNLESAQQCLEEKRKSLSEEVLKTHLKNAELEVALKSVQRRRKIVGEFSEVHEYEARIRKLQSEKECLQWELTNLRTKISSLESQINKLIQEKTELSADLDEEKRNAAKRQNEYVCKFHAKTETFTNDSRQDGLAEKYSVLPEFCEENSGNEIRDLQEVAAELETKYNTCKKELETQRAMIKTSFTREEAATRVAEGIARDLQLKLDDYRLEIEKRDVMIETLEEDKRNLRRNSQECERNYKQNYDFYESELEYEKAVSEELKMGKREMEVKLRELEKVRQMYERSTQKLLRQKTRSSASNLLKQKEVVLFDVESSAACSDYAKRETEGVVILINGKSILQPAVYSESDIDQRCSVEWQEQINDPSNHELKGQQQSETSANDIAEYSACKELDAACETKYQESCLDRVAVLYKESLMADEERITEMDDNADAKEDKSEDYDSKYQGFQHENEGAHSRSDVLESDNGSLKREVQTFQQIPLAVVSNDNDTSLSEITDRLADDPAHRKLSGDLDENSDLLTDEISLKNRKEELENLCEVLMDERDAAKTSLKEKETEVFRLRQRAVESEQEKGKLRKQLLNVLDGTEEREKALFSAKEENKKLRAEVEFLRKKVGELETENKRMKFKLNAQSSQKTEEGTKSPSDAENEEEIRAKAKEATPVSSEGESDSKLESQENQSRTADLNSAVEIAAKETVSAGNGDILRNGPKRTAPNFYRHSFAGSLPRPFQSFDASRDDHRERTGSDASGDSETESQTSVPSFMRRRTDKPFLKPGFAPVAFNYKPLPESISSRRESWGGMRSSSISEVMDRGKAREQRVEGANQGKDLAESSSDSESGPLSSSASTTASVDKSLETLGQLNSEESKDGLNQTTTESNGGEKDPDEKFGVSFQLRSRPPDAEECSSRAQNSDSASHSHVSSSSAHEAHATFPSSGETNHESNVDDDEKGQENVSNLVDTWNSKSDEVIDV